MIKWEVRSREELQRIQLKKLRNILEKGYQAPFYKRKFDKAQITPQDVKTLIDLNKLPITSKPELPKAIEESPPFGGLVAVPTERIGRYYISPGPIIHALTYEDVQAWAENAAKVFYLCGARPGDIVSNTQTYHMAPGGLLAQEGFDKLGCAMIPMGPGQTRLQVEIMNLIKPTVIVGFTEFLLHIAEVAKKEMGIDPKDFSLRLSMSVPLPPRPQRNQVEEALGLRERATQFYGVAELGPVGAECTAETGIHVLEESFIIELVDPVTQEQVNPGEKGEIVLTSLDTEGTPKIRYGTGDVATHTYEPCACGLKETRILEILGRVDEITKVKGLFIFPNTINAVIKNYSELGRFQAIVDRPATTDSLMIKVEYLGVEENLERIKEKLKKDFKEALRIDTEVEFVKGEEIPPTGKRLIDLRKGLVSWTR